jgi:hypothetical protein
LGVIVFFGEEGLIFGICGGISKSGMSKNHLAPDLSYFVPFHMLEELHPMVAASKASTLWPVSQSWCNNTLHTHFFCNTLLGF